jgi:hypothetical protein
MEENLQGAGKLEFFDSPEQLQASMQQDTQPVIQSEPEPTVQEPVVSEPQQQAEHTPEPTTEPQAYSEPSATATATYSDDEIDGAVFSYLSEKLGREINAFDDINIQPEAPQLDARVSAISDFVSNTGRSPEDWFTYQSLNTEAMDDMTAVRVSMAIDNPGLSHQELNLLVNSKYNLDPDTQTEQQVQLAQLQLKMDAAKAREGIEKVRTDYAAPVQQEQQPQEETSFIDDEWIANMSREVDALEGLEFDLGEGNRFTFGLSNQYRNELKDKNARLDEFFDPYVDQSGNWDYDKLSSHRAVIDNIDAIVANAYKQGMSAGRKGLVNQAANVSMDTPQQATTDNTPSVVQQLNNIVGLNKKMTFNI